MYLFAASRHVGGDIFHESSLVDDMVRAPDRTLRTRSVQLVVQLPGS